MVLKRQCKNRREYIIPFLYNAYANLSKLEYICPLIKPEKGTLYKIKNCGKEQKTNVIHQTICIFF